MPRGLDETTQADFSAGMFQAPAVERIPPNGCYDIVNGFLDADAGDIYRRGGAIYKTPADIAITPLMLWDGGLGGGNRTLLGDASSVYMMDAGDTTVSTVSITGTPVASARPVVVSGMAFWPSVSGGGLNGWVMTGGSRQTSDQTGSGTVATGVTTIDYTGSGGLFGPQAQAGSVLTSAAVPGYAVPVAANDGSSKITLAVPWPGGGGSGISVARSYAVYHEDLKTNGVNPVYLASAANRLWWMNGSLIRFTAIGKYAVATEALTNYHSLPSGEVIRGGKGLGNSLMVFTNGGTWAIRNAAYNLTDAFGNPQQQLALAYPELRLWHINGVVSYKGALVVPATDGVYLIDGSSSPVSIADPIDKLYRSYTAAGYTVGAASISNGTYELPVLNGTTWVDTLSCYLPRRVWTRQAGYSGQSIGFATRVSSNGTEKLLSIRSLRVLDCSGWFAPVAGNKNEADGSTHSFSFITRDYGTAALKVMFKKLRLWIEGVDAASDSPTLSASYSDGLTSTAFTSLTGTAGASTGESPAGIWTVNVGDKHLRFKFSSTSPWASLKIKAVDVFTRAKGRA